MRLIQTSPPEAVWNQKSSPPFTTHRGQPGEKGNYLCFIKALLGCCWRFVGLSSTRRGSISFYALSRKEKIQTKVNLKLFVAIRRLGVIKRQQSQTAVAIQFNVFILRLLGSRLSLCTLQSYYSASISQLCTMISGAFKNTTLKCASR